MRQPEPQATELPKGELFAERYEVEGLLGRGGMGAVYRARDLALGETIALKLLNNRADIAPSALMRFRQEVRLARRVTHPNVARVYDIGEHAGVVYLTMELVGGDTLRALLRREGRLAPARAVRVALALCEGLRAAHAAGVVHRDLKPANVLVDEAAGRVVITDFGIARSLTETSDLTAGAIGTPSYMAPEQLCCGVIDARTDIYALGRLVQEMLTGERPRDTARSLDASPALDALLRRCTALTPDERPASIDEVARDLALAVSEAAAVSGAGTAAVSFYEATTSRLTPMPYAGTQVRLVEAAPALAVLPFRYRGPKEQDYFGDAVTDELVDALSRTRGMRVLGSGATARYREARDPRAIGADLGAGTLIDGTVRLSGARVRITVRLLATSDGIQLWTERYDADLGDLCDVQETIAQRVAEELRVELTALSYRGAAPATAIEAYLSGRHQLRSVYFDGAAAAEASLARCLALAPDFAPALAPYAVACLRCWFYGTKGDATDWESAARAAVTRALERADGLAETHLAVGILAIHMGDYRGAALAITRSLAIAPTYAEAHEYMGMLQCEAGRTEEGITRLRLATALDPTLPFCSVYLAHHHALRGRYDLHEATLAEVERRLGPSVEHLVMTARCRIAAWQRNYDALHELAAQEHNSTAGRMVRLCAAALTGAIGLAELRTGFARVSSATENPRFVTLAAQLATEVYGSLGLFDEARVHLLRAVASGLVDVEWMERCPVLVELRSHPDWADARRRVRARAAAVWTM